MINFLYFMKLSPYYFLSIHTRDSITQISCTETYVLEYHKMKWYTFNSQKGTAFHPNQFAPHSIVHRSDLTEHCGSSLKVNQTSRLMNIIERQTRRGVSQSPSVPSSALARARAKPLGLFNRRLRFFEHRNPSRVGSPVFSPLRAVTLTSLSGFPCVCRGLAPP